MSRGARGGGEKIEHPPLGEKAGSVDRPVTHLPPDSAFRFFFSPGRTWCAGSHSHVDQTNNPCIRRADSALIKFFSKKLIELMKPRPV